MFGMVGVNEVDVFVEICLCKDNFQGCLLGLIEIYFVDFLFSVFNKCVYLGLVEGGFLIDNRDGLYQSWFDLFCIF